MDSWFIRGLDYMVSGHRLLVTVTKEGIFVMFASKFFPFCFLFCNYDKNCVSLVETGRNDIIRGFTKGKKNGEDDLVGKFLFGLVQVGHEFWMVTEGLSKS